MKKIDLHQDIILSFIDDLRGFENESKVLDMYGTYAGNLHDYKGSQLQIVRAANRPYLMEGDINDLINRKTTYDKSILLYQYSQTQELAKIYNIGVIREKYDLANMKELNIVHHIEGIENITSIDDIKELYDLGIRSVGFVWNFDNSLAHTSANPIGGLTALGIDAVQYMNELGMIIDTAHMNHASMMDVLRYSSKPILNSHSNLKHFCPHTRNVEDEFLYGLAKNGGVLGLSVYGSFISATGKANIEDYIEQVRYVKDLIGEEHVVLGSDYHGLVTNKCVKQLQRIRDLKLLEERMIQEFGQQFTQKFFYDNSMRVLKANLI